MDLMTLAAKLTLDDKSFQSGIKDAESAGEKLAGKMSAMTVAVGNIASDLIKQGFNAVKNMIGGAVDAYADYQQLIGGVNTLFGEHADKVAAYAKQSFKTVGISANQYMETVTSFSASLLHGLKGDTDAAAELANMAVTDMADNANKMGTDIASIQTAYQGFAKQNYTMLDNLKLGYGGTKEEMVRLINESGILDKKIKNLDGITFDQIIEAIHAIQTQMEITGTTALEAADTISGSKASLKAAWEDLMSAVGGEGEGEGRLGETLENFKQAFSTYMDNYIPQLQTTINNIGQLVQGVADAVKSLPTDLISNLFQSGLSSGADIINGASDILNWLIDSMITSLKDASIDSSRVEAFGYALGSFLGTSVSKILTNLPGIVDSMFQVGVALAGSIISGIWDGLFGTGNEVDKIKTELSSTLTEIEAQTTTAGGILNYMDDLVKKYGDAARETEEWKGAEEQLESIMGGSTEVFNQYGENVAGAVAQLRAMNEELRKTAVMNALEKAGAEQLELLTTQTLEYNRAKGSYGMNEAIQKDIVSSLISTIMTEAASKQAGLVEQFGSYDEMGNAQKDLYNKYQSLSEGMSHVGDRMTELTELDFSGLTDALNFLESEAYSTEELEGKRIAYENAQAEMDAAKTTMEETQKEIDATKEAIAETNAAMEQTVKDLLDSGKEAGSSISEGTGFVVTALDDFANAAFEIAVKLKNMSFANPFAGAFAGWFMPRAVGIDYVPYDGFKTELHKGEAVITREENERRNGRVDYGALEASLEDAIERSMARMNINMNGERVGDITTKRVAQNIVNGERAYARAMGG